MEARRGMAIEPESLLNCGTHILPLLDFPCMSNACFYKDLSMSYSFKTNFMIIDYFPCHENSKYNFS